jgi:hypothetical protein
MSGTASTILLGKSVTISGVTGARSCTVTNSANEIDVTALGDTSRKFRRGIVEQTIEIECVDVPGVTAGNNFTIGGTGSGNATYVCTSVKRDEPLDGIVTYTVSGTRTTSSATP